MLVILRSGQMIRGRRQCQAHRERIRRPPAPLLTSSTHSLNPFLLRPYLSRLRSKAEKAEPAKYPAIKTQGVAHSPLARRPGRWYQLLHPDVVQGGPAIGRWPDQRGTSISHRTTIK